MLDLAATIVHNEAAMATAIAAGTPVSTVMGTTYEQMLLDQPQSPTIA